MSVYILCLILFSIGLYCVVRKRNVIKIIIGIGIMDYAVNLFMVLIGYRIHGRSTMVDPLPQAVVLAAIVIGLAVTLTLVAIAIRIYDKYGTFDITKINRLRG
jgi:multicomponent Na+:H+ antiporter subunit C